MGFFSRIKKLWGSSEPQGKAISETEASDLQAPSSPGPENVLVAEDQQPGPKGTLEASGREDRLLHGNAEPAAASQPRLVQSAPPVAKEPAAEKSGGWRRLFGLDTPKKEDSAPATQQPELLFQEKPSARAGLEPWQEPLVQALGEAEPRLSVWMTHILDGVDRRGELLWNRLRFLFSQLDVPAAESEDFIHRFEQWLADMDYDHVDEFRSELQYRMALALDLEDEEDERNRLLLKLSAGLGKTREQLTMRIDQLLAMTGSYDDEFWEELEEILLVADVGVKASQELLKRLKPKVRKAGSRDAAEFKTLLKEELAAVFVEPKAPRVPQPPEVVLMVGVNGAGKTTTIAKLAHRAQMQGRKVLVAAGDTFRAAAIEQLQVWSKRVGAGFYAKPHGSDPAAVAFEAVDHAMQEGYDLLFVDTAGRLQTKHNLMEELKKINRVLGKKLDGAPHRTILILDATTGQNALSQVKLFSQASPVDEIILTKLDGTAKGGVIVAIALEYGLPISFVGLGEKMEDLRPFSGQEFASALFD
ncbi:MAG: signal recognition particle-docking protein FtsY [Desulfovibrionales bacterium]|nr:signal recognition particle-docking protein FtsY [Desulfovibrionales bacterium]